MRQTPGLCPYNRTGVFWEVMVSNLSGAGGVWPYAPFSLALTR